MNALVKNNLSAETKFRQPVEGATCVRFDAVQFGPAGREFFNSRKRCAGRFRDDQGVGDEGQPRLKTDWSTENVRKRHCILPLFYDGRD